jgi:hypothetical protein
MSLFLATLVPGLFLALVGAPLLLGSAGAAAALKAFPRSSSAAWVLFGGAAAWFLYNVWHLSPADFGDYRALLFIAFAAVAILAFKCVPDFLAVRGACILGLLAAAPLLNAAYMEYSHPQRLFMVSLVYVVIAAAIWIGAQPWRARDFIDWLFSTRGRSRAFGGVLLAYGLLLCGLSFTY